MNKNQAIFGFNKKLQRSGKALASGKIIRWSVRTLGNKKSIRYVVCTAPFMSCNNYAVTDEFGIVRCNKPFRQCKAHCCKGKITTGRGSVPTTSATRTIAEPDKSLSQK